MAAASSAVLVSSAIGLGASLYTTYQGQKEKERAKAELDNYERHDLQNAFENIQISTLGSDLAREETQRTVASIVESLQYGGSRAVASTAPQIQAGINDANRKIQLDLDQQVQKRDYAIAEDEARIRGIKENRDFQNIDALSSQYNAGQARMDNGMMGAMSSIAAMGRGLSYEGSNTNTNTTTTTNPISKSNILDMEAVNRNLNSSTIDYDYVNPFRVIPQYNNPNVERFFTEKNMYA